MKIKRWITTTMAGILAVGLVACEPALPKNSESFEETGSTASTGSSSSSEVGEQSLKILSGTQFSDGVAFISVQGKLEFLGESVSLNNAFAIDTEGKILYRCSSQDDYLPYSNGVTLDKGLFGAGSFVYDKTGNTILSPTKNGYDFILAAAVDEGLFLVGKQEEAFEGDRVSIGILHIQGEYVTPLSETQTIAAEINARNGTLFDVEFEYMGNGIVKMASGGYYGLGQDIYYYDMLQDKISEGYVHYEEELYGRVAKYDENNNKTYLVDRPYSATALFDDAILVSDGEGYFGLIDYEGKQLTTYGENKLTKQSWEWSGETGYYYADGYLLSQVENATGSEYCCLFTPTGELAFDPIKMNDGDHFYALTEEGFVYKQSGKFYFYQRNGERTEYPSNIQYYAGQSEFCDGLSCVTLGEKGTNKGTAYIDYQGKVVISAEDILEQLAQWK